METGPEKLISTDSSTDVRVLGQYSESHDCCFGSKVKSCKCKKKSAYIIVQDFNCDA